MTITQLIQQLKDIAEQTGPNEVVRAWCPERQDHFPITGILYAGNGVVDLFTESDEDYGDE